MKLRPFKLLVWTGISAGLLVIFLVSCPQVIPYWRFTMRSQQYYAKVAAACDEVIAKADPLQPEIRGEKLRSLPAVLQDLRPAYLEVFARGIMMRVDAGLMSDQIIWASDERDPSVWRLSIRGGDGPESRVVFTTIKQAAATAGPVDGAERVRLFIEHVQARGTDPHH